MGADAATAKALLAALFLNRAQPVLARVRSDGSASPLQAGEPSALPDDALLVVNRDLQYKTRNFTIATAKRVTAGAPQSQSEAGERERDLRSPGRQPAGGPPGRAPATRTARERRGDRQQERQREHQRVPGIERARGAATGRRPHAHARALPRPSDQPRSGGVTIVVTMTMMMAAA